MPNHMDCSKVLDLLFFFTFQLYDVQFTVAPSEPERVILFYPSIGSDILTLTTPHCVLQVSQQHHDQLPQGRLRGHGPGGRGRGGGPGRAVGGAAQHHCELPDHPLHAQGSRRQLHLRPAPRNQRHGAPLRGQW